MIATTPANIDNPSQVLPALFMCCVAAGWPIALMHGSLGDLQGVCRLPVKRLAALDT